MFRSQFQRNAIRRILPINPRQYRAPSRRSYSQQYNTYFQDPPLPPVRALGPALWVLTASATIYMSCALYEVHQDITTFKKQAQGPVTYETLTSRRDKTGKHQSPATREFMFMDIFTTPWSGLNSAEKALTTVGALNTGIFALTYLAPSSAINIFMHTPASARNFTMFTSMFGHAGPLHLFVNMYGLSSFGPGVAASPTFNSSGSHLTAFYLSAGLFASLAAHINTIWPQKLHRLIPGLGASGALFALLGVWGMSYPEARIGVLFVPGSVPAEQALMYMAAFETYGALIGIPFLRWGHAAHLGGLAAGVAYVYFDGGERLWQPARRLAFKSLRRVGIV